MHFQRSKSGRGLLLAVLTVALTCLLVAPTASGQESTPETFPEPEEQPTVERDIEDTDNELRVAFIGLIAIAAAMLVLMILYWQHTGRSARRRFEETHGQMQGDYEYPHDDVDEVGFYEQPPGWR